MPSTYDLITSADTLLATSGDLTPEEFDATLAAWLGDSADKAERLAAVRFAAATKAAAHKEQAEAHTSACKRHAATIDRCASMMTALLVARRELGETPKIPGVARLQRNGGKVPVVIADPSAVPSAYCIQPAPVPDKETIRAMLLDGIEVPGAVLGEVGESLRWEA